MLVLVDFACLRFGVVWLNVDLVDFRCVSGHCSVWAVRFGD